MVALAELEAEMPASVRLLGTLHPFGQEAHAEGARRGDQRAHAPALGFVGRGQAADRSEVELQVVGGRLRELVDARQAGTKVVVGELDLLAGEKRAQRAQAL